MQKRRNLFRQAPREEGNRLSGLRNFRSNTNGQDIEILQDVSGRKKEKGEKKMKLVFVFNEAKEGGIDFDAVTSASRTINCYENRYKLQKHKRMLKNSKTTEEQKKEYENELQYFNLDNLSNEMATYYKPFIENEMRNIKIRKLKEIEKGLDICVVCMHNRVPETIREYFKFGYTLSVRPYAISKESIMVCFTKKKDIDIHLQDIILKDLDVCNMELTFDTPREYKIITHYKGITIGDDLSLRYEDYI